ncbi:MAG: amidohydrolase family protein [Deltaproteobacteria bacterium]|nr:amidohydrolase family protein [Deltaproteobacteria bacterium]
MEVDLVVKGGKVVTPGAVFPGGVAIDKGKIIGVCAGSAFPASRREIDVKGKLIFPGIVDPEAHPGRPVPKEIKTESRAAAAGGITTWGIQSPSPRLGPHFDPRGVTPEDVVSFNDVVPYCISACEQDSSVDFFLTPMVETDEQAEEIPIYAEKFGITSYKFYLHCKNYEIAKHWSHGSGLVRGFDSGTVYIAMENVAKMGPPGVVSLHCEDWEIGRVLEDRLKKQGRKDMAAWTDRSPPFTEAIHVAQYSYLAKVLGCAIHIQHVTTPETIEEIGRAKERGVIIYGQTGPHYLSLPKGTWKINVPLRDEETIEKLWEALAKGFIDAIGSDHVVSRTRGKRDELLKDNVWDTISGFSSRVESFLPVMLSEGVNKGKISLQRLAQVASENPAKIWGLYPQKGNLLPGSDADLTIVDLEKRVTVQNSMIHSTPGWSIYEGKELKGWPVMTILRGEVIMEWKDNSPRAEIVGSPGGKYVRRSMGNSKYWYPL